ncbi:hypothetical protein RUM44_008844 [Polyplax serrata]|uniref:G-protein coupled receptors family 1 profile domain-containing protein n=1 Tax=Polyplax serrata TaxID=468196 RepID=A0ABR1BBL9_POLSC
MKDSTTRVLQALTLFCVAAVGLFLNIIVILVFYKRPALRSSSNRFVLSLVVANFISVLVLAPVLLFLFSRSSLDCFSQLASCLPVLVVTASVFSILVIAIDRYNAVLSPLHYSMTITSQRNKETIAAIWCVSLLLSTPPLLGVFNKRIRYPEYDVLRYSYATALVVFVFIVPLLALMLVYFRMYIAAHKNSERTRRQSIQANAGDCSRGGSMDTQYPPIITTLDFIRTAKPPMLSQIHKRRISNASFSAILFREEGRAVKTAVMVVASFIICWAPFFVLLLMSTFELLDVLTHTTLFLCLLLIVLNSILSPFIYVFRNEIARNEAVRLMFWWKKIGLYEGNVLQQANKELKLKSSDGRIQIRHQSSSNYDSMSVQSFQLPVNYSAECKQCAESSHIPVADFIATYEVVNMKDEPKTGEEIKVSETKTRGESVTFRLAFLPQRRCQTCVRQNSDSSSGSAHFLLRESESPTPIHTAKRQDLVSKVKEEGYRGRLGLGDSPKQSLLRKNNGQTIVEMEEQANAEAPLICQETIPEGLKKSPWSSKENSTSSKKKFTAREGGGGSAPDLGAETPQIKNNGHRATSPTVPKRHRHKLQRLSAVEDDDGVAKAKTSAKVPPCDFG